jgi:hypothetical protein
MAKPKLALIPAAQGDKFYSVLPSDGVGDFTFSRASTGTRIAPTGLIEEVPSGDSRLDYDLLNGKVVNCPHYLLEPARTNSILYSQDFSNSAWTKGTNLVAQSSAEISPDGSLNATKFTNVAASSVFAFQLSIGSSSSVWTSSVFVKKGTNKYCGISITSLGISTSRYQPVFNLEDGTIQAINTSGTNITNASNSITQYANGWYKVTVSVTFVGGADQCYMVLQNTNNTDYNPTSSTLDWQNASLGNAFFYGAQLEQGSYPTSYIPTTTTTITRAAESANGSGDAATFNDSEGVLMAEISALADDGTYRLNTLSDNTSNNFIVIGYSLNSNKMFLDGVIGGVRFITLEATVNQEEFNKVCLKYKSGDASIYLNGFKILSSTTTFAHSGSPISELEFDYWNNTLPFYGKTRELQYFDSVLTDAQLETLTSWTSLQEMITSQLYTNY